MHTYSICFQLFPFKHRLIADKTVSFKILQLRFACLPTNEDMVIVDGHNCFRVCEKHGLPYKILMFSFADFLEASSGHWMHRRVAAIGTSGSWASELSA